MVFGNFELNFFHVLVIVDLIDNFCNFSRFLNRGSLIISFLIWLRERGPPYKKNCSVNYYVFIPYVVLCNGKREVMCLLY